jgi:hypothetical protein
MFSNRTDIPFLSRRYPLGRKKRIYRQRGLPRSVPYAIFCRLPSGRKTMKPMALIVALFVAVCATSACGGGGDGSPAPVSPANVTGNWSGSWLSTTTGRSGNLTFDLTQTGLDISGTFSRSGSACFTSGDISGSINGENVTLSALFTGSLRVDFEGTVVESQMDGSYQVSGGACADDSGTWTVTKQ